MIRPQTPASCATWFSTPGSCRRRTRASSYSVCSSSMAVRDILAARLPSASHGQFIHDGMTLRIPTKFAHRLLTRDALIEREGVGERPDHLPRLVDRQRVDVAVAPGSTA